MIDVLRNKEVLITGATGFIGVNLVKMCLDKGAKVHIFSRKSSNRWRIKDVLKSVNEYYVDLLDYRRLKSVISRIKPEIILHTAVYGGYSFQRDENKIIKTNIIGTMNLVNVCSIVGFKLFVNTGSSSEYGLKNKPMKETDLLEPNNIYGVTKAAATLFCQERSKSLGLPIVTLRFFSPYGYYEDSRRLVSSLIISGLMKKKLKLLSPNSVRDFIFIEDVMSAYMNAIEKPNINGEIFNIGSGKQYTVKEVANKIMNLTDSDSKYEYNNTSTRLNEPKLWVADISKANKILNWRPHWNIDEGLRKTIEWFKKNISLYKSFF